jgi:hypothetical protein
MKEKILAYLKTKIGGHAGGIQEAFLVGIADKLSKTITEEEKISTEISDLTLETIKASYDSMQSEVGRRTTVAQNTHLKKWREEHGLDENGKPIQAQANGGDGGGENGDQNDGNVPDWFKKHQKKVETETAELRSKLAKYESEKTHGELLGKVHSKLKEKGIPLSFLGKVASKNLTVESEDKIDSLVAEIEGDWTQFTQDAANAGVNVIIPKQSSGGLPDGEAKGKELAQKRNAAATEGVKAKKL